MCALSCRTSAIWALSFTLLLIFIYIAFRFHTWRLSAGAIVAVMKVLAPSGKLELAALTPNVHKVFHMTRMDSVFTIHAEAPDQGQGHAA